MARGHIRHRGPNWAGDNRPRARRERQTKTEMALGLSHRGARRVLTAFLAAKDNGERVAEAPARLRYGTFLRDQWLPYLENRVTLGTMPPRHRRPRTDNWWCAHPAGLGGGAFGPWTQGCWKNTCAELRLPGGKKVRAGQPPADCPTTLVHHVRVAMLTPAQPRRAAPDCWPATLRPTYRDLPGPSKGQQDSLDGRRDGRVPIGRRDDRLYALTSTPPLACDGEVAGLSWDQLDLDGGTLAVARARVSIKQTCCREQAEDDQSQADHYVPVVVGVTGLPSAPTRRPGPRSRLDRQAGSCSPTRTVVTHPDFILHSFQRTASAIGLPVISFHGLRHGATTVSLAAGVPTAGREQRLGPQQCKHYRDRYGHVVEQLDSEAADRTAALLSSGKRSKSTNLVTRERLTNAGRWDTLVPQ